MEYVPRLLDAFLEDALTALPAIAVDGPKAVGKTATASRHAGAVLSLDDDPTAQSLREDPDLINRLPRPLLIDEWQYWPPIWDKVRHAVDTAGAAGLFLLSGSATPKEKPKHSGAGRIVHVRLRPFTLAERQLEPPTVSLKELLAGRQEPLTGRTDVTVEQYAEEIVRGGLPALRSTPERFRFTAWEGYLAELFERDLPELGRQVRRPATLMAWLRSYARATAGVATYTDILDNAMPADVHKPTKATTLAWRELLGSMWLLDPLPAWDDPRHKLGKLGQVPKHHLMDPALAAHLLGLTTPDTLLTQPRELEPLAKRGTTTFGGLFESLVTLSVRVYAEATDARASHLRTRDGRHEVDLIVTRPDGRIVAFEVKSTPAVTAADAKHLLWLRDKLGDDLLDAAIITTGTDAYRRQSDGIAVVPAALLGP
ncbi:MAG: DUF4143 domain-containing protein [Bifidobacteriaceae bacterium]|nr:DUF4143 domain-containing protein [Bifidobacteriaceae bacterium]